MKGWFKRKPLRASFVEIEEGQHEMKRHLGAHNLVMIGIGTIIGAGIFVITGQAAAVCAGPAVVLSFTIAAIICVLTALCYAELASLIPVAGGSYSYTYIALGELPAWIVGWAACSQCIVSASIVAVGWSGYFGSFLRNFNIEIPVNLSGSPFSYNSVDGLFLTGAFMNLPAIVLVILLGLLISIGTRAASLFNNVMVIVKLSVVALFIVIGISFIDTANWVPFIPENSGHFGEFGWSGILRAAGLVFFAYMGFDSIATLAQDAVNPQKNVPRGILGSLIICAITYVVLSLVLVGIVPYPELDVPDPISIALRAMGPNFVWFKLIVEIAILAGLSTVVLVQMLAQSRLFLAISKDGLLPNAFSKIHSKRRTPVFSSTVTMIVVACIAGSVSIDVLAPLVSITTLFIFVVVCMGVWILRHTHPELHRGFKVSFVPAIPLLSIFGCVGEMLMLPLASWIQLVAWLLMGLVVYFFYSVRHSKIRNQIRAPSS